jgi:hypothetical protein
MKAIVLLAAMSALMMAQDAKMVTNPPAPAKPPSERSLSETEVLKMQNWMLEADRIQKFYKVDEFNEKMKPISMAQHAQYIEACYSIGLTDAEIAAQECGFNIGIDLDGKPIMGPDGKPMPAKVWKIEPAKPAEKK